MYRNTSLQIYSNILQIYSNIPRRTAIYRKYTTPFYYERFYLFYVTAVDNLSFFVFLFTFFRIYSIIFNTKFSMNERYGRKNVK